MTLCRDCIDVGVCGQSGCTRAFPGLQLADAAAADPARWLYVCPWCGDPVLMAVLRTVGRAPNAFVRVELFDTEPWSPADDVPADGLKPGALKSWRSRRRRELGLSRFDFLSGTFLPALAWPPDDIHVALFKVHRCQEMVG